jgi:shikimate dehydrogenase
LLGSQPYLLYEMAPEQVENFVRKGSWHGLNVTIPYKRKAYELADKKSPRAERLGVANTLVRQADGTIYADNTDLAGFSWMLQRFCKREFGQEVHEVLAGAPVLVLGSGGASQAIQAALTEAGATVSVISRKGPDTYENLESRHSDAILVVNTTPVGMYPRCPSSPLSEHNFSTLRHLRAVLDVVYNPTRTGICLEAERRGLPYESGLAMLVGQARFSSELFQDKHIEDIEVSRIEAILKAQMLNVCLIGMPGVGKTSTGMALAHRLKRPFVDIDEAFRLDHGISAASYIEDHGETAFRDLESEMLAHYGSGSGLIISCGGGVVTRPQNYALLHQNGQIIMLERPLENLSTKGRPLSRSKGIAKLAEERMGLYRAWADVCISCTGTPTGDAELICSMLKLS